MPFLNSSRDRSSSWEAEEEVRKMKSKCSAEKMRCGGGFIGVNVVETMRFSNSLLEREP